MIGDRLREERERLALTQPAFAEVAGAKKRTLIDWEKGVSSPTAVQLSALAKIGANVRYILTGITDDAQALLDAKEERIAQAVNAGMNFEEVRAMEKAKDPANLETIMALLQQCRVPERVAVFELVSSIVGLRTALASSHNKAKK